jgi:hypothetical protein
MGVYRAGRLQEIQVFSDYLTRGKILKVEFVGIYIQHVDFTYIYIYNQQSAKGIHVTIQYIYCDVYTHC